VTRFLNAEDSNHNDISEPMLQFDVIDTGIGITPEQMNGLFKSFSQADASTTRKFGGTGLGLIISKRLSNVLGGDIAVYSKPGEGSTFRLKIITGPVDCTRMLEDPAQSTIKPVDDSSSSPEIPQLQCRILLAEDGPDNHDYATKPIDRNKLYEVIMKHTTNSDVHEHIKQFLQDLPGQLKEIDDAVNCSNFEVLAKLVYQLSHEANNSSFEDIMEAALNIEDLIIHNTTLEELQSRIEYLNQLCQQVIANKDSVIPS